MVAGPLTWSSLANATAVAFVHITSMNTLANTANKTQDVPIDQGRQCSVQCTSVSKAGRHRRHRVSSWRRETVCECDDKWLMHVLCDWLIFAVRLHDDHM